MIHNTDKDRFEVTVEGRTAIIEYMMPGNKIIFSHTEVPVELEGNGIGIQNIRNWCYRAMVFEQKQLSYYFFIT